MTATVYRTVDSPVGLLTLAGHDEVLTHLRMDDQAHPPAGREAWIRDDEAFPKVVAQLVAYFAGELTEFDVAFELAGTAFQRRVWSALLDIPYGETASYGDVARRIGHPTAYRAVGLANGRNPVAVIVPCHRVIGSSGTLTGYGGGLDRKRLLLELERSQRTTSSTLPLSMS
jgi:methylated-DNA-[protein]-cysteine S-methyltransferase